MFVSNTEVYPSGALRESFGSYPGLRERCKGQAQQLIFPETCIIKLCTAVSNSVMY